MQYRFLKLAYEVLREKGHTIGRSVATALVGPGPAYGGGEPSIQTEVDGQLRTRAEVINLAMKYPEWHDRVWSLA
jgi:hypothetical protein